MKRKLEGTYINPESKPVIMRDESGRIILANPDVLHETHVPPEIHARDEQLRNIQRCLSPLTDHRKPVNCWLHGSPGAGKTSAARWMLRKLREDNGIRGIYVNCWEYPTFFSILERVATELRLLGSEKLSTSFKLERLKARLSEERVVLFLDEIDQPPPSERMRSSTTCRIFPDSVWSAPATLSMSTSASKSASSPV